MLPVAVDQSSSNDNGYVLLVLWITSWFHTMERMGPKQRRRVCFVEYARWRHRERSCCLRLQARWEFSSHVLFHPVLWRCWLDDDMGVRSDGDCGTLNRKYQMFVFGETRRKLRPITNHSSSRCCYIRYKSLRCRWQTPAMQWLSAC